MIRNEQKFMLATSKKLAQSHDPETKQLKHTCEKWINYEDEDLKNLDIRDMSNGLKYLIKSLKKHWERDPVLLVDEIDKPIVNALEQKVDEDNLRGIGKVITNVVCGILKTNDKALKLAAALVTGISKVINAGLSPLDNTTDVYFLSDTRFSQYYGMTEHEVTHLVKTLLKEEGEDEISKIIGHIKECYNGYYQNNYSGEDKISKKENNLHARYCLFSVLSYLDQKLHEKQNTNIRFWKEGGLLEYIVGVMKKSDHIMKDVHSLMFNDTCASIPIKLSVEVNAVDLLGLYKEEEEPAREQIFNFFLHRGFLARDPNIEEFTEEGETTIHVKIPNWEVRALYKDMFSSYIAKMPKYVRSSLSYCGEFLKNLPAELNHYLANREDFQNNLNNFCGHLSCIFRYFKCTDEFTVNSHVLALAKYHAGYENCEGNFEVKFCEDGKSRYVYINLFTKQGQFIIIWEMKFNATTNGEHHKPGDKAHTSLAAAEDIVKLLPNKLKAEYTGKSKAGSGDDLRVLSQQQIKNHLLVGLAVDGDGTAHMLVFPNSIEWGDVIQVCVEPYVKDVIAYHLKQTIDSSMLC